MKLLALLILAAAVIAAVFFFISRDADGQTTPFAYTKRGCVGCEDYMLDSNDTQFFEAAGNLSGSSLLWVSRYRADIGVRWMRLTVTANAAEVYLISAPSSQHDIVLLGNTKTLCLYSAEGARAAVIIRGNGQAHAVFVDGDNGCAN